MFHLLSGGSKGFNLIFQSYFNFDKISFLNKGSFEDCQPFVIETGSLHRVSYHLIDSFSHSVAINRDCCISVDDPRDGEERAVSSTGKYFE